MTVAERLCSDEGIGWSRQEVVEATLMGAHAAFTTTFAQAMHLEHDAVGPDFDGYF